MTAVSALPAAGDVLFDARDSSRSMRVNWHVDAGLCVLSIWHEGTCVATFQLTRADVPELIKALMMGPTGRP